MVEGRIRVEPWQSHNQRLTQITGMKIKNHKLIGESISTSPTMCLLPDAANRLVWSGHRDGKVRAWAMNVSNDNDGFEAALTWQAHRASVLSMVVTSYGKFYHYILYV